MIIKLMAIGEYFIVNICAYYINGYWWLFHCKPLVVIDGYFINDY